MVAIEINRNRCEGKGVCLSVCPENVFELANPSPAELSLTARIKLRFHSGKQAFAVRAEDCTACMLCVERCPEDAISITASDET